MVLAGWAMVELCTGGERGMILCCGSWGIKGGRLSDFLEAYRMSGSDEARGKTQPSVLASRWLFPSPCCQKASVTFP